MVLVRVSAHPYMFLTRGRFIRVLASAGARILMKRDH